MILVGTSGWHYKSWKGPFYPENLSAREFLPYYAERFKTVEINNSFYRLPERETFAAWRDAVQEGFFFAVKASRYITHMKKLRHTEEVLSTFLVERVGALGGKLGPVLFQLPPRWRFNGERFAGFLEGLPAGPRYVFEFRDRSWMNPEACELLRKHNASFCIYDLAGYQSPAEITADFVYVRLHGSDDAYCGKYSSAVLSQWAEAFAAWSGRGLDVYCYFDNDEAGYAAQNALELAEMTTQRGGG